MLQTAIPDYFTFQRHWRWWVCDSHASWMDGLYRGPAVSRWIKLADSTRTPAHWAAGEAAYWAANIGTAESQCCTQPAPGRKPFTGWRTSSTWERADACGTGDAQTTMGIKHLLPSWVLALLNYILLGNGEYCHWRADVSIRSLVVENERKWDLRD